VEHGPVMTLLRLHHQQMLSVSLSIKIKLYVC
jgi:hypothetical protein